MAGRNRVLFWDFDGTLAHRKGRWAGCLLEILDEHDPLHEVTMQDIRPWLDRDFPWLQADRPHPHLGHPDAWWASLDDVLTGAFRELGYHAAAPELAACVRGQFIAPERWQVFDDTIPVLETLAIAGWRHVIVSNHVPELAELVQCLGLAPLIDGTVNSAAVGYEKPHPQIYAIAREVAGDPRECWMIGDDPVADVEGAEAAGIPAVLVRRDAPAARRCDDLTGVIDLLTA